MAARKSFSLRFHPPLPTVVDSARGVDKPDEAAAHLLKPYLPPRDRKLRLPDIYEMFEQMKDHA